MIATIKRIVLDSQYHRRNHQKNIFYLDKVYAKADFDAFTEEISEAIDEIILTENVQLNNPFVDRLMDFLANFIAHVAKKYESENKDELNVTISSEPLLRFTIEYTLKLVHNKEDRIRFNACKLLTNVIKNLGDYVEVDVDLFELIVEAMLDRIMDIKVPIRVQVIRALERLQDPHDQNCRVVKALMSLRYDASSLVRKEIVAVTAPANNQDTISYIASRTHDTDQNVRAAAFKKCADINARLFPLVTRHEIIISGLRETSLTAKNTFSKWLLPKWLAFFQDNFLDFLRSLKLDSDEDDVKNTLFVYKNVMLEFFKTHPMTDFINILSLEDKMIPLNRITSEGVLFWKLLVDHVREFNADGEYLHEILPELTPFCDYIEKLVQSRATMTMETWQYLDYQLILQSLFKMVDQFDLSDEFGKKRLMTLVTNVLQTYDIGTKVVSVVMPIMEKLSPNKINFITEVCTMVADIREPLTDRQTESANGNAYSDELSALKLKLLKLDCEKEQAVERTDFLKAQSCQNDIIAVQRQLDECTAQMSQAEKVREVKNDPATLCRCLDIIIALLETKSVTEMTSMLATCKSEFIVPLLSNGHDQVHWRVLKCLALLCIIDRETAVEYAKLLTLPIVTYRHAFNENALLISMNAVTDMIIRHGCSIFGIDESETTSNTTSTSSRSKKKLLNRNEETEFNINDMITVDHISDALLSMLDDDMPVVQDVAVASIGKLMISGINVKPLLVSRLILKWYNPSVGLNEKRNQAQRPRMSRITTSNNENARLPQYLGVLIDEYANNRNAAKSVIEKAVIPTLITIAEAPLNNPLADIDVDNVIKFLACITNDYQGFEHLHGILAEDLFVEIGRRPRHKVVPHLIKMLSHMKLNEFVSNLTKLEEYTIQLLNFEDIDLNKKLEKILKCFLETVVSLKPESANTTQNMINETAENRGVSHLGTVQEQEESAIDNQMKSLSIEENNEGGSNAKKPRLSGDNDEITSNKSSSSPSVITGTSSSSGLTDKVLTIQLVRSSFSKLTQTRENEVVENEDKQSEDSNKSPSVISGTTSSGTSEKKLTIPLVRSPLADVNINGEHIESSTNSDVGTSESEEETRRAKRPRRVNSNRDSSEVIESHRNSRRIVKGTPSAKEKLIQKKRPSTSATPQRKSQRHNKLKG